ncbi:MAG: hypothetical protein K0S65_3884, partial [Labilithrix sp.]|nr:hypothetical protein [Labilithrix sp.]
MTTLAVMRVNRARGSAWRAGCTRALLIALALGSRRSEAAEVPFDIDLVYEAPPQCPARREVLDELRTRADPSWRADFDRQRERRSFNMRIERRKDGTFSGRLEVTRPGHAPTLKEFQAGTCRAVSSALNLFIAIALDPTTSDDDAPATESRMPGPVATEPMPPPDAHAPSPARPPPSVPAARTRPRRSAWVLSSELGFAYVRAPRDAWGARVSGQVARVVDGARVAPAFRLSWGFADFEELPPDGGKANFRFTTGRAAACALVALDPVPVAVAPCVGFDFGSLAARSSDIVRVGQ